MCAGTICVGFQEDSPSWWIFTNIRHQNDLSITIDDDDYLFFAPQLLSVCSDPSVCESLALQNAYLTSTAVVKLEWNGINTYNLNYTVDNQNERVDIRIYLLDDTATVNRDGLEVDMYIGDFVVEFTINSNSAQESEKTGTITSQLSHSDASCLGNSTENALESFQFSDCQGNLLGFALVASPNAYTGNNQILEPVTTNYDSTGQVDVVMGLSSSPLNYWMYVKSGREPNNTWAIVLSVIGMFVVLAMLAAGLVGYIYRKRKLRENPDLPPEIKSSSEPHPVYDEIS